MIDLQCGGDELVKCPLYPWLMWDKLDKDAVTVIKELLDISEKIIGGA